MAKQDYYETLGVAKNASADDLKKAYRKMAMQYHPDHNGGDKAAEIRFVAVGEAYAVLKDDQKRAAYDRFGHAASEIGSPAQQKNQNKADMYATKAQCDYILKHNSPEIIASKTDTNALYRMSPILFIEIMVSYYIDLMEIAPKTAKDWLESFVKNKPDLLPRYLREMAPTAIATSEFANQFFKSDPDGFMEKMMSFYIQAFNVEPKKASSWLKSFLKQKPEIAVRYLKEMSPAKIATSGFAADLYKSQPEIFIERTMSFYTGILRTEDSTSPNAITCSASLCSFLTKNPKIAPEMKKQLHLVRLEQFPQLKAALDAIPSERKVSHETLRQRFKSSLGSRSAPS